MLSTGPRRIAVAATATAAALIAGAALYTEIAKADTEHCSTAGEYDQITDGMSVGTVQRIFDVQGNYADPDGGRFKYRFRSCSGEARFVIVFSELTGLTVDKHIADI